MGLGIREIILLKMVRVVHMPEFHCELTASPWCDSITDKFVSDSRGPVSIGNDILDWHRYGDWKRFDSTLYIKMIPMVLSPRREI